MSLLTAFTSQCPEENTLRFISLFETGSWEQMQTCQCSLLNSTTPPPPHPPLRSGVQMARAGGAAASPEAPEAAAAGTGLPAVPAAQPEAGLGGAAAAEL